LLPQSPYLVLLWPPSWGQVRTKHKVSFIIVYWVELFKSCPNWKMMFFLPIIFFIWCGSTVSSVGTVFYCLWWALVNHFQVEKRERVSYEVGWFVKHSFFINTPLVIDLASNGVSFRIPSTWANLVTWWATECSKSCG
jgi:hypothetical protein